MKKDVFKNYSKYYDLLYKDKDYSLEAEYIRSLLKKHSPHAAEILEFGCGTGIHAHLLHKMGYQIEGIDLSEEMLEFGRKKHPEIKFHKGNIGNINLGKKFDAVISIFHVFSYLTSNEDLFNTFTTASSHLKEGGVLLFDCWYGPGVITDKPQTRVKRLENESISVCRIAESEIFPNNNTVNVNYTVLIKDKKTDSVEEIRETHKMRYLFTPEVEFLCERAGLKIQAVYKWLNTEEPDFQSWNACFIARK
ncbi:MAG: class I SAM-dependent methyltransferase [Candidatus Riflebacteria bacterium]|nr:class I SAM-dependent methyltransferase [Candidatus Riflebacteria bacterium]